MKISNLRLARRSDFRAIVAIDHIAPTDKRRRAVIAEAVKRRACYVAVIGSAVAGYCVFDHAFFERGFVSMLVTDLKRRRMGIGSALMRHIEKFCRTELLFTSTNSSNHRMRRLLRKLGYERSGRIDNLDEADPELIFCKRIRRREGRRP